MNNTKNLFVTPNEKLLCIKGTEHLFSVCHKTSDFITETLAENIEEKTAHLFAAAPDLLSALQWFADELPGIIRQCCPEGVPIKVAHAHESARNAIAKAKGAA